MDASEKFFNVGDSPGTLKQSSWYIFTPYGNIPTPRVGHTATYIKNEQIVVFVGGAIPDGVCEGTWILNLTNSLCTKSKTEGDFDNRYEHCAFSVASDFESANDTHKNNIWIFAGASMDENKNDLWELNLKTLQWNKLMQQGCIPSKRTLHVNAGAVTHLIVYGGGSRGAEAVADPNTYEFDTNKKTWSILETTGEIPSPRHGHLLVTDSESKVYVHGGINELTFFDDLYIFNSGIWTKPAIGGIKPSGRASHGGIIHKHFIYILGGLTKEGVVNDFWRLNIMNFMWEQVHINGSNIPPRLDFAMTLVYLPKEFKPHSSDDLDEVNSVEEYLNLNVNDTHGQESVEDIRQGILPFILTHGGMDDKGMIFDDLFLFKLDAGAEGNESP